MAGGCHLAVEIQVWTLGYLLKCLFERLNKLLREESAKGSLGCKQVDKTRMLIGRLFDLSEAINECYGFCLLIFMVSRGVFCQNYCYKVINFLYHLVKGSVGKAADANFITTCRNLFIQATRIYIQVATYSSVVKEVSSNIEVIKC